MAKDSAPLEGITVLEGDGTIALPRIVLGGLGLGDGDQVVFLVPRRGTARIRAPADGDRGRALEAIKGGRVRLTEYVVQQLMAEPGDQLTIRLEQGHAVMQRHTDGDWGLDPTWLPPRTEPEPGPSRISRVRLEGEYRVEPIGADWSERRGYYLKRYVTQVELQGVIERQTDHWVGSIRGQPMASGPPADSVQTVSDLRVTGPSLSVVLDKLASSYLNRHGESLMESDDPEPPRVSISPTWPANVKAILVRFRERWSAAPLGRRQREAIEPAARELADLGWPAADIAWIFSGPRTGPTEAAVRRYLDSLAQPTTH